MKKNISFQVFWEGVLRYYLPAPSLDIALSRDVLHPMHLRIHADGCSSAVRESLALLSM
jgi:hypothetical protein